MWIFFFFFFFENFEEFQGILSAKWWVRMFLITTWRHLFLQYSDICTDHAGVTDHYCKGMKMLVTLAYHNYITDHSTVIGVILSPIMIIPQAKFFCKSTSSHCFIHS